MTRIRLVWLPLAALLCWLAARPALAHEFRPAVLTLDAAADGEVVVRFIPPAMTASGPTTAALEPVAPDHCIVRSTGRWSCGAAGLTGTLGIKGLASDPVDVLVQVRWADGAELHSRLGPDRPSLALARGAAVGDRLGTLSTYFTLGAEHIIAGIDHLLFVVALLLLGGRTREHVRTITAFTLGHALTLVTQSLLGLSFAVPWVEACIVASIVVAAAEGCQARPMRSMAWLWALGFGVIHGLGFAGSLAEIGLPPDHRIAALFSFNLGVEAGQLAVVLVLLSLAAAVAPRDVLVRERLRRGLAFAVGAIAVAWTIERVTSFWSYS